MMKQKPSQCTSSATTDRPPKKGQKIRKLIIVHENTGAKKQDKEGK